MGIPWRRKKLEYDSLRPKEIKDEKNENCLHTWPATDAPGVLKDIIFCGMNVARFNFSHGTHEEHKMRFDALKLLREELCLPIAALLDTKGPEIRLKHFEGGKVVLEEGQSFTLTTRSIMGNQSICGISYKDLPHDLELGSRIMLDDGLISMRVEELTSIPTLSAVWKMVAPLRIARV